MSKTNPEIYIIITNYINNNSYKEIKRKLVLSMYNELNKEINKANNKLDYALKLVITSNLIDFVAKHQFNERILKEMILNVNKTILTIDDTNEVAVIISNGEGSLGTVLNRTIK